MCGGMAAWLWLMCGGGMMACWEAANRLVGMGPIGSASKGKVWVRTLSAWTWNGVGAMVEEEGFRLRYSWPLGTLLVHRHS